jgi:hypothetical protein
MVVLADSLQQVASHSRRVNTDVQLRRRLAQQQVEDRVPEDRQVRRGRVVAVGWRVGTHCMTASTAQVPSSLARFVYRVVVDEHS